jgi:hypothetical protein
MVPLAILSHCMLFLILILLPAEARQNLSARGNNTQIRRAMCGRMRYKRGFGQVGIDWHVKIIKQINDRAWQTRGRETATATGGGLCKYATSYLLN